MRSLSIIVADDHPVVLGGLVTLLSKDKSFKVVARCGDGVEAIAAIRNLKPDLALLDMNMPSPNGLQILKAVVAENLATRVIFLAALLSDQEIVSAISAGAYGLILKEAAPETLITCLRAVAAGKKWHPAKLVDGAIERSRESQAEIDRIEHLLTRREIEVMTRSLMACPIRMLGVN
jgi:two-component system nitrate/nitrite response regulator NarL